MLDLVQRACSRPCGITAGVSYDFSVEAVTQKTVVAVYPRSRVELLADSDLEVARDLRKVTFEATLEECDRVRRCHNGADCAQTQLLIFTHWESERDLPTGFAQATFAPGDAQGLRRIRTVALTRSPVMHTRRLAGTFRCLCVFSFASQAAAAGLVR